MTQSSYESSRRNAALLTLEAAEHQNYARRVQAFRDAEERNAPPEELATLLAAAEAAMPAPDLVDAEDSDAVRRQTLALKMVRA